MSGAERGQRESGSSQEIGREIREPEALAAGSVGGLWVFGYGSLMWRPGFAYVRRCKALLRGWRRSLCVYSHVYRGSPERPGLVLGLDRGGACPGVAFEVDAALGEATVATCANASR